MNEFIIKVSFFVPVDGQSEYYFGSLAAIFERFTVAQIGCGLTSLWNAKITPDHPKATRRCVISKHPMQRKPQKNS